MHAFLVGLAVWAPAPARTAVDSVMLDWSGFPASTVERCQLREAEALVAQHLSDAGYALVPTVAAGGLRARLSADEAAIFVQVERNRAHRTNRLPIPAPCDPSLALEIGHLILTELRALPAQEPPPPPPPAPWPAQGALSEPVSPIALVDVMAGVLVPGVDPLAMLSVAAGLPLRHLDLGALLSAGFGGKQGLRVVEGASLLRVRWSLPPGEVPVKVAISASAGMLVHGFDRRGYRGFHLDGRFGAGLELGPHTVPVLLHVVVQRRLRAIDHRLTDATHMRIDVWGMEVALGWRLQPGEAG